MTTAKELSPTDDNDVEFAYGAGQIDPSKAANPSLVYDAGKSDYIKFLCGHGYSSSTLHVKFREDTNCSDKSKGSKLSFFHPESLNLLIKCKRRFPKNCYKCWLTPITTYKVIVTAPQGLDIEVKPF